MTHRCFAVTFTWEVGLVTLWSLKFLVLWVKTAHPRGLWAALSWRRGHLLFLEAETSAKDAAAQRDP